jgi:SP family myo-inositol transporter-like MFS transporter 13
VPAERFRTGVIFLTQTMPTHSPNDKRIYNWFLLLVAGLGGLLYGIDVGIIGGALPYLEATANLTPGQLSIIVAAVLLGGTLSTLFAGVIADRIGRKLLMVFSGLAFSLSIPIIALSHGYEPLFLGRLLQGMSAGLIGVVVPLYLAECLPAAVRGRGTAIFQWMLTLGIVAAAFIGIYFSYRVAEVQRLGDAAATFAYKNQAWRSIFWVSLPPGLIFTVGSLFVAESPRWLFKRNRKEDAHTALLRSRTEAMASIEMAEMEEVARSAQISAPAAGKVKKESLLHGRYIKPFLLACALLAFNAATGINVVIGFFTGILLQSGLSDLSSHWGYVAFTAVNFVMTILGLALIDRKGRRFLFITGTSGILLSLVCVTFLFHRAEQGQLNCRAAVQSLVQPDGTLSMQFNAQEAVTLMRASGHSDSSISPLRAAITIIFSYGGFTGETNYMRSDSLGTVHITRAEAVPANRMEAFFKSPFTSLAQARTAPLKIESASISEVPSPRQGWIVAALLYCFVAFYAMGPGVCIWLALSELMPTRIRSNGMSIALVLNQLVNTLLLAAFLPFVSKHGYSSMFLIFVGCTLIYVLFAIFLVPETKGKTLEEIEKIFE